jgi:hypothetical protein
MRYQGVNPELSEIISRAGWARQRQIAEGVVRLVRPVPTPAAEPAYAAISAHQFGDSPVRHALAEAAEAADDRYAELRDRREDAEEAGQPFPVELDQELNQNRRTARYLEMLAEALGDDPDEAAQEVLYLSGAFLPAARVEQAVRRMLIGGQDLRRLRGINAWMPEHREPTDDEVTVAFENNGRFWYSADGKGPFAGEPQGEGYTLFQLV